MAETNDQKSCPVCVHPKVRSINRALARGETYRYLGDKYAVNKVLIGKHEQNCLTNGKTDLSREQKANNAFEFELELRRLYQKSLKMLAAAEEWLSDPDDPDKLDISPRDNEIFIIYRDHNDRTSIGQPRRKKVKLCDLLEEIQFDGREVIRVDNTAMDNRKLFLETFKTLTDRLEQLGKFHDFWKPAPVQPDTEDLENLRILIAAQAKENGNTFEEEARFFLALPIAETVRPEIKARLISELVQ